MKDSDSSPHQSPHSLRKTGLAGRTDIPETVLAEVVAVECPLGWLHDCWVSVEAAEEYRSRGQDSGSAQLQLPNTSTGEGNMNSGLTPWSTEEIPALASAEVKRRLRS